MELQVCATTSSIFKWDLESKLRYSCLCGKNFISWWIPLTPAQEVPLLKVNQAKKRGTMGKHRGSSWMWSSLWTLLWRCEGSRHHRKANVTRAVQKEQVRKGSFKGRSRRREATVTRNGLFQQGGGNWGKLWKCGLWQQKTRDGQQTLRRFYSNWKM